MGPSAETATTDPTASLAPAPIAIADTLDAVIELLGAVDPGDGAMWTRLRVPLSELINALQLLVGGNGPAATPTDPPVLLLRQLVHVRRLVESDADLRDFDRPGGRPLGAGG